jgi:hypothetical protein
MPKPADLAPVPARVTNVTNFLVIRPNRLVQATFCFRFLRCKLRG